MKDRWITITAKRVLYVDDGINRLLCDRGHSGNVTLLLFIESSELERSEFHELLEMD